MTLFGTSTAQSRNRIRDMQRLFCHRGDRIVPVEAEFLLQARVERTHLTTRKKCFRNPLVFIRSLLRDDLRLAATVCQIHQKTPSLQGCREKVNESLPIGKCHYLAEVTFEVCVSADRGAHEHTVVTRPDFALDDAGRIASRNGAVGNVASHDRTGRDDAMIPDPDTWQDNGACANKAVGADKGIDVIRPDEIVGENLHRWSDDGIVADVDASRIGEIEPRLQGDACS